MKYLTNLIIIKYVIGYKNLVKEITDANNTTPDPKHN